MKHIQSIMEKYDDVAEALKTTIFAIIVTIAILGFAPAIMWAQANGF